MSEYQELSELEHILKFPHLSLGNSMVEMDHIQTLDVGDMKIIDEQAPYCRAIERLYLEILHNAGDNAEVSRSYGIDPGRISITVSRDTVRIRNEGRPISTRIQPNTGIHVPEFIFSRLRVSGNYSTTNKRKIASTHGLGAKLSNIFSVLFHLDIGNANEKMRYTQVWKNNTNDRADPVIVPYDGPSYTQITFIPDFARFYDEDTQYGFATQRTFSSHMLGAFAKHAADMSFTAKIPIMFNNREINCIAIEEYARLYHRSNGKRMMFKSEDSECLIMDTPNAGRMVSFVNGTINTEGGIHVRSWKKDIYSPIHLSMKKLKPKDRDIDDHITMILACRLVGPKFKSQTKDYVTYPRPTVNVDQSLIGAILKWEGIIQLEEILKGRLNAIARKSDGAKKSLVNISKLVDAHAAGGSESHLCTLYITEGDSAANFAIKGIQNGTFTGAMPIKGKLLNVGTCSIEQYANNDEITELKKALGLREDYNYEEDISTLRYGKLVILSDQDVDGMHIRGLILNFFRLKYPSLLRRDYVQVMDTPLIRVGSLSFYHQHEYDEWARNNPTSRQQVRYYKGLGTSSDAELLDAFEKARYTTYTWDEKAESLMSVAFDPGHEDSRKELLLSWCNERKIGRHSSQFEAGSISHFVTNQLAEFSNVNTSRTIPSVVDGLKECQRKVMCVVLSMKKAKKVSQLKGEVSDKMQYKYGDDALGKTIVGLGNYAVGTNNIPLIKAKGQYDSRMGPGTAADDRYIYAQPSPFLGLIFRPEDECVLEYQMDGDDKIEPTHYYPIIPMFAINGAIGIGSGFSTNIPNYNPIDVIRYIIWWLSKRGDRPTMSPWYKGYQGKIERMGDGHYSIGSFKEIPSRKRMKDILVTEIPVTQSIKTYISKMEVLQEKPIVKGDKTTWIKAFKPVPKNMVYKSYGEDYIEIIPHIVIEGAHVHTHKSGPLRMLGLIEKICETNNTLIGIDGIPSKYKSIYDAIDSFCVARYEAYETRRNKMMSMWKASIDRLNLRKEFIHAILNGQLVLKNKTQAQLVAETKGRYPSDFFRSSILTLTIDGIKRIDDEIGRLQAKYDSYDKMTAAQIWRNELKELHMAIIK